MTTRSLTLTTVLTLALGLTACNGSKDSGDDTAAPGFGDGGDGGGGGGSADEIESCEWDIGICYEFVNESGISDWCDDMQSKYDIGTSYADGPCPSGEEGTCENLTGGEDFGSRTATAFYYSDWPADPEGSCDEAGGDFSG